MDVPLPELLPSQALIRIRACAVCRTDLHVVDGELPNPKLPLIPGHEIVGTIEKGSGRFRDGDRVGVPWLGYTCGQCAFCRSERENLCDHAQFTGYQIDGGYAEYCVANERFCFPIPAGYPDIQAAPLLCAGLIGYRSFKMAGRRATARLLRIRRGRAHLDPVGQVSGPGGFRIHQAGRPRGAEIRHGIGRRVGRRK